MNRLRLRLQNFARAITGPFQKRERVLITIAQKTLSSTQSHRVSLDLSETYRSEFSKTLPIRFSVTEKKIQLEIPSRSSLRRATWIGWESLWNGFQVSRLQQNTPLQVELPANGWWNIQIPGQDIDLTVTYKNAKREKSIAKTIVSALSFKKSRDFSFSTLAHALAFAAIIGMVPLKDYLMSQLTPEFEEAQVEDEQKMAQAAATVLTAISEREFSGKSLYFALRMQAENNVNADSMAKNLTQLKSMVALNTGSVKVSNTPTQGVSNQDLAKAALALQGSGRSGTGKPGKGLVGKAGNIQWDSRFLADGSGKGNDPVDQKQLHDLFSKIQDQLRGCYETALFIYEDLAVTVSFEGTISPAGQITSPKYSVSGNSTPESKKELLQCLTRVMSKPKVSSKLSGVRVKNQFLFKS